MKDNTPCGCTTTTKREWCGHDAEHYCEETPPYHFGNHVCACGHEWENK